MCHGFGMLRLYRRAMTEDGIFDAKVAQTYDRDHGGQDPDEIARIVSCLAALAAGGPVLEFAIGTGRIALPLRARDVPVQGIELSRAMVAELRKKERGDPIPVAIGDMTTTGIDAEFALVYLVFNTIDNLTEQRDQVACFCNAAAHLRPGGHFLIETQVPPVQKLPFGETRIAFAASDTHMGVSEVDVATQRHVSHHVWTSADGDVRKLSAPFRYAWPAELDLMAQLAGLSLAHRWSDWSRAPFDRFSTTHISVWQKPPNP